MNHKHQHGFTLIEIIIVVALISLIVSLGYPSYAWHVKRAKITEATSHLGELQLLSSQHYQDEHSYIKADGTCAVAAPANKHFNFACSGAAHSFTWTASNKANVGLGLSGDFQFTIDHHGTKTTTSFDGSVLSKNCWILSPSTSC
ncbi:MAG: prepilin-type N-terminal cleavage/methylation domain-containing protein [Gammaproteobacteria bacterium]|nr:prepilin-type N-terminal cleavage/methylation domain-containing protein [Gammaproteobacteria bacterium]MDH5802606.1 prepilin-type N-terminal cleavage/methylation domain-containing protein [Gammaproteobacteria bacterium]